MPVSRSRTSRSASFSSLLRPRYSTRTLLDLVDRRGRRGSCERGVLECLGVHGSAEVTNGPCLVSLHEALEARSRRRTAASDDVTPLDERLRGLRVDLRRVGGGHDGGRRLLRRARREAEGPVVELAVGTGRIAIPIAERTARRVIGHRPLAGDARASHESVPPRRASSSELREATARPRARRAGDGLVTCPYRRAARTCRPGADRRRVFERVSRSAPSPGGRFAWNAFVFDHRHAAERGREQCATDEPRAPPRRQLDAPGGQPRRHHARGRTARSRCWWVTRSEWDGLSTSPARDRGALRLVRPRPSTTEPRVRLGRPQAG